MIERPSVLLDVIPGDNVRYRLELYRLLARPLSRTVGGNAITPLVRALLLGIREKVRIHV